jgi:hypothetical protein
MRMVIVAGFIIALCPAAVLAQSSAKAQPVSPPSGTVTTSNGQVADAGGAVTASALAEQKDPKLVGSPAWWSTHSTADGQPARSDGR